MQDDFLLLVLKNLRRENTPEEHAALLRSLNESEDNRRIYAEMAASFSMHETLASPALPCFVVMSTTPLAPWAP